MPTFHTPMQNQGQIVTVSYAWSAGCLYRRVHDASDGEVVIRRIRDPWDLVEPESEDSRDLESWDPWMCRPPAWLDAAFDAAEEVSPEEVED